MRRRLLKPLLAALSAVSLLALAPAQAAVLSSVEGKVAVNRGSGYAPGAPGDQLKPGDRVMVTSQNGQAVITYDNECIDRVERGRIAIVQADPPCGAPAATPATTNLLIYGGASLAAGTALMLGTRRSSP